MLKMALLSYWWVHTLPPISIALFLYHSSLRITFFLLSSLSTEATQPRSLTSPGTPTSPGSSAQCLRTTLCKSGKWWVNWDHILLIHVGSRELDFFFIVFYSNRENYLRLTCAGTCTGLQQPGTSAPSVIPKQGVQQSRPLWIFRKKKVVRWDFPWNYRYTAARQTSQPNLKFWLNIWSDSVRAT